MHDGDGERDAEQRAEREAEQGRGKRDPAHDRRGSGLPRRGDEHGLVEVDRHLMRRGERRLRLVERGGDEFGKRARPRLPAGRDRAGMAS